MILATVSGISILLFLFISSCIYSTSVFIFVVLLCQSREQFHVERIQKTQMSRLLILSAPEETNKLDTLCTMLKANNGKAFSQKGNK